MITMRRLPERSACRYPPASAASLSSVSRHSSRGRRPALPMRVSVQIACLRWRISNDLDNRRATRCTGYVRVVGWSCLAFAICRLGWGYEVYLVVCPVTEDFSEGVRHGQVREPAAWAHIPPAREVVVQVTEWAQPPVSLACRHFPGGERLDGDEDHRGSPEIRGRVAKRASKAGLARSIPVIRQEIVLKAFYRPFDPGRLGVVE